MSSPQGHRQNHNIDSTKLNGETGRTTRLFYLADLELFFFHHDEVAVVVGLHRHCFLNFFCASHRFLVMMEKNRLNDWLEWHQLN
jgi:hypothetical protein